MNRVTEPNVSLRSLEQLCIDYQERYGTIRSFSARREYFDVLKQAYEKRRVDEKTFWDLYALLATPGLDLDKQPDLKRLFMDVTELSGDSEENVRAVNAFVKSISGWCVLWILSSEAVERIKSEVMTILTESSDLDGITSAQERIQVEIDAVIGHEELRPNFRSTPSQALRLLNQTQLTYIWKKTRKQPIDNKERYDSDYLHHSQDVILRELLGK